MCRSNMEYMCIYMYIYKDIYRYYGIYYRVLRYLFIFEMFIDIHWHLTYFLISYYININILNGIKSLLVSFVYIFRYYILFKDFFV
jgi:hypothetical protein